MKLLLINSNDPESQSLLDRLGDIPSNIIILRIDIERYKRYSQRMWGISYIPSLKDDTHIIEGVDNILGYLNPTRGTHQPVLSQEFEKLQNATFTTTPSLIGSGSDEFETPNGTLETPSSPLNITYSTTQDVNSMKAQASEFLEL